MIVLGVDPGYERCGLAVLSRDERGQEALLESTCVVTERNTPFSSRLLVIGDAFVNMIQHFTPSHCAIEKLYFTSNQKTAMHVAEVRGMLIYLATHHRIPLYEYTPNEIKVAIAGDGRADKKQVIRMVPRLVRIEKEIPYDDEYDAIAVALTASAVLSTVLRSS